ncbi:MAG: DUF3575 domain-containing protein [Tannerellaceae bacterium]|nr:DUF3575 domain-containing protein [Tannerellaceae bacterium]
MYIIAFIVTILCLPHVSAQRIGVKSNLLYDVTTTINIGLEVSMAPKWTIDLPVNYNPWEFSGNKKLKHWLIQPEVRYWTCEKFNGHFVGFHAHIAEYNIGGIKWIGLQDHRYQGNLYGAGLSYGYQWILNTHWSLEATVGLGYAFLSHAQYPCEKCTDKIGDFTKNYFGPTKAGVSLIYIIK